MTVPELAFGAISESCRLKFIHVEFAGLIRFGEVSVKSVIPSVLKEGESTVIGMRLLRIRARGSWIGKHLTFPSLTSTVCGLSIGEGV